jgi:hypothetical protein
MPLTFINALRLVGASLCSAIAFLGWALFSLFVLSRQSRGYDGHYDPERVLWTWHQFLNIWLPLGIVALVVFGTIIAFVFGILSIHRARTKLLIAALVGVLPLIILAIYNGRGNVGLFDYWEALIIGLGLCAAIATTVTAAFLGFMAATSRLLSFPPPRTIE